MEFDKSIKHTKRFISMGYQPWYFIQFDSEMIHCIPLFSAKNKYALRFHQNLVYADDGT